MKVTVTKNLNVRVGAPSINAPNLEFLLPGAVVETDGKLYKGDWYDGNQDWYRDTEGNYYWSGGVEPPTLPLNRNRIIIDLHCHPSLKPYNQPKYNIWRKYHNPKVDDLFNKTLKEFIIRNLGLRKQINSFATYSQSNLEACFKGKNKLLFASIYPVERPFVYPDRPFKKFSLDFLFGKKYDSKKKIDQRMIQLITGFSSDVANTYVEEIQNESTTIDYFQNFLGEYHTLKEAQNYNYGIADEGIRAKFKLVNSFKEISNLRSNEVAAIVNIEGAHSLGKYSSHDLLNAKTIDDLEADKKQKLEKLMLERIAILKGKKAYTYKNQSYFIEHTPFYLTLSHHFNNLISGHAKSFSDLELFNQEKGVNGELTKTGCKIIRELLSTKNGRRILIDTKHMSIETRQLYHKIAIKWKIPIICSHTAVNGLKSFDDAKIKGRKDDIDKNSYISRMDINLTDEDIRDIFVSNGIIGVCMHDGRMPGDTFRKIIKVAQGKNSDPRKAKVNRLYTQLFLMNVFHIVRVNREYILNQDPNGDVTKAWDTVCLGTDFDGIIDPFNHLSTAENLENFKLICIDALEHRNSAIRKKEGSQILLIGAKRITAYNKKIIDELMMGMSPKTLMDKVFSLNILNFLEKHFNEDYLTAKT